MPETKKPKQKKTKTKTKVSQHQSNKQRVTVNVHVGSKGGRGGKSKGGSRQPQPQQQMRPSPTVVNVSQAQPLPPMPHAPYVAIPTERPTERIAERITMIPGATVAGNIQNSVDRSLNSATQTVSSIPSLMGSYAPAGNSIKMPEYEDDAVSEMSYDTPYQHSNPPMDMSDFLAMALPFKEQPISQPISAMKAYAKEPASLMMPIPMSEEELDFKRYYNYENRSVASDDEPYIKSEKEPSVPSVNSGKGPAPSVASHGTAARNLAVMGQSIAAIAGRVDTDAGTVISTPSHVAFKAKMTNDSGVHIERLKRMSKPELAQLYIKYYDVQPHKGKTKAVLLDDVLKRFKK